MNTVNKDARQREFRFWTGVLVGTLILLIFKRLVFDSTYVYLDSSKLIHALTSLFGLIIMLSVPMAIGGAIAGLIREIMKTASER
ncbi:hypothetical protein ig2599ANME_1693 [groundwater metagenome]